MTRYRAETGPETKPQTNRDTCHHNNKPCARLTVLFNKQKKSCMFFMKTRLPKIAPFARSLVCCAASSNNLQCGILKLFGNL